MKISLFSSMLIEVWDDLREPVVAWQIGAIVLSLFVAWYLARLVQRRFSPGAASAQDMRLGTNSFARFLAALFSLALVFVAKLVLMQWLSVNVPARDAVVPAGG